MSWKAQSPYPYPFLSGKILGVESIALRLLLPPFDLVPLLLRLRWIFGQQKAGAAYQGLIFRHPGCLIKTLGFPPHPREWFSIIVYRVFSALLFNFCQCAIVGTKKSNLFVLFYFKHCPIQLYTLSPRPHMGSGNKKAGSLISYLIFRHPGCLIKTLGFPPHPRRWFSIIVYRVYRFRSFLLSNWMYLPTYRSKKSNKLLLFYLNNP